MGAWEMNDGDFKEMEGERIEGLRVVWEKGKCDVRGRVTEG